MTISTRAIGPALGRLSRISAHDNSRVQNLYGSFPYQIHSANLAGERHIQGFAPSGNNNILRIDWANSKDIVDDVTSFNKTVQERAPLVKRFLTQLHSTLEDYDSVDLIHTLEELIERDLKNTDDLSGLNHLSNLEKFFFVLATEAMRNRELERSITPDVIADGNSGYKSVSELLFSISNEFRSIRKNQYDFFQPNGGRR